MKITKIKWFSPNDKLPRKLRGYNNRTMGHISIRVMVIWEWDNAKTNVGKQEMRFAQYNYNSKYWCIEGIMGDTKVLFWGRVIKPK